VSFWRFKNKKKINKKKNNKKFIQKNHNSIKIGFACFPSPHSPAVRRGPGLYVDHLLREQHRTPPNHFPNKRTLTSPRGVFLAIQKWRWRGQSSPAPELEKTEIKGAGLLGLFLSHFRR